MGLFSKKKVDTERSDANKATMRALFNKAVPDGDSYKIAYGYSQHLKMMNYLIVRSQTITIASLIVGYRDSDMSIVLVPTVPELDECGEPQFFKNTDIKKAKIVSREYVIYNQGGIMAGYTQFGVVAENDDSVSAYVYQSEESADFAEFWKRFAKK
jgi:hypothetical protein